MITILCFLTLHPKVLIILCSIHIFFTHFTKKFPSYPINQSINKCGKIFKKRMERIKNNEKGQSWMEGLISREEKKRKENRGEREWGWERKFKKCLLVASFFWTGPFWLCIYYIYIYIHNTYIMTNGVY